TAHHPDIAAQWHPDKNGDLTPDKLPSGSHERVWWKCGKGPDHEWQASVKDRTRSDGATGCPCCNGKQASITNSLAALFPKVATQWHPTKNGDLTPDQVPSGSHKKVWWKCDKDHKWPASVKDRTRSDGATGCPYCNRKKVSDDTSLEATHPAIA